MHAKMEARRGHIVAELISTERTYVRGLETLLHHFKNSAKAAELPPDDARTIFNDVEVLLSYNTELLAMLLASHGEHGAQARVGDVFKTLAIYFRSYKTCARARSLAPEASTRRLRRRLESKAVPAVLRVR